MQSVHGVQNRAANVSIEAVNDTSDDREELRIQMPRTSIKPRKRLTREESRAQTRATLIAEGRKHFLRYGLGGAVAEKIAEDAGYSRGALYSNFDGKEELFLAVIQEEQALHLNFLRSLLKEEPSVKKRLKKMRDAIADLITIGSCFVLNSRSELFEANVSGKALLKCIGSSFATEVSLSGTSCDLLKSLRD